MHLLVTHSSFGYLDVYIFTVRRQFFGLIWHARVHFVSIKWSLPSGGYSRDTQWHRKETLDKNLIPEVKQHLKNQSDNKKGGFNGSHTTRDLIWFEIWLYFFPLGVSLAQDRGRLEARIEVLSTELETQKKQNERDYDALKIKAKIVDDQTETIRKLKEVFLCLGILAWDVRVCLLIISSF